MISLNALTYNIHKGFSSGNAQFALKKIKQSIHQVHADLVFLQEVVGHHEKHGKKIENWPNSSQFEYLADQTWSHYAYGKNALYTEGHHGNAILSKYPIVSFENEDVSYSRYERRGLLHAVIQIETETLHAFCVHLGLFEKDRSRQILRLCERITARVPADAPLIIAGDFNDWKMKASPLLKNHLDLRESFVEIHGQSPYTFPSWYPLLSLDRMYYRNLECFSAKRLSGKIWSQQSDHLPLLAGFHLSKESS